MNFSRIGLGCGGLGDLDQKAADALVHQALDLGVQVFDTARSYGASEERLAHALEGRQATLVTKGGYQVEGEVDWTPRAVTLGIERALRTLRRETLEVFLLHSGPFDERMLEPLLEAKRAGKVLAVGYSGDGPALEAAVRARAVDVLECSVSVLDQASFAVLPHAAVRGCPVIAKRVLANSVWRYGERPQRSDEAQLWDRHQQLFAAPRALEVDLAVRFAAWSPGVSCALVGTRSGQRLRQAVQAFEKGPLPTDVYGGLRAAYPGWPGLV
jgi:aryl-alcohol dehydrogenase-like predicted oxidoreductase